MDGEIKFLKPYVVTVVEVRQKQLVVYAEGESDAAWAALKLVKRDAVTVDAAEPVLRCKSVTEADPSDKKWYPMYGMNGSV